MGERVDESKGHFYSDPSATNCFGNLTRDSYLAVELVIGGAVLTCIRRSRVRLVNARGGGRGGSRQGCRCDASSAIYLGLPQCILNFISNNKN